MPLKPSKYTEARRKLHQKAIEQLVHVNELGVPDFADRQDPKKKKIRDKLTSSEQISAGVIEELDLHAKRDTSLTGQKKGEIFEDLVLGFLEECFSSLSHIRPGNWKYKRKTDKDNTTTAISQFLQYEHLALFKRVSKKRQEQSRLTAELAKELECLLGAGYLVTPDIVIFREQLKDTDINAYECLVDDRSGVHSSIRARGDGKRLLHASISCKYTLRSDRSQNARTEALNLLRNRKGRVPHIVVVTAEPLPSRIASLALGTGDVDCVYHFMLSELRTTLDKLAAQQTGYEDSKELLDNMIAGNRLRDISDLPLDLAV